MKKTIRINLIFLVFFLLTMSMGNVAKASGVISLGDGTYTVGQEIPPGLNKFSVPKRKGASVSITRGKIDLLYESLDGDKFYSSNQMLANLKTGDIVEITLDYGTSKINIESVGKLELSKIPVGFYEIGTDIPAGTYTIKTNSYDDPWATIEILDKNNRTKEYFDIYSDESVEKKFSSGDKIYITDLIGTVHFKEKILVPKSITINKSSLSLMVNRTAQLKATVNPSTAVNKTVGWSSSHPEIATVDSKGNVKALKAGKATITATAKGDPSVKKSIPVTVTKVVPTGLKLSKSSIHIATKDTYKVKAAVTPADAANKAVIWKSSNTKVAKVDSKGNITGISSGSAAITATAKGNAKVSKKVTVKVSPKTVKLNRSSLSVTAGKSAVLKATVSPKDTTNKKVTWKSSNRKIATVNSKGKVTGKSKGTTAITATVKGAKPVKVKVTVTPPVQAKSIKLNKKAVTLSKGSSTTLKATISPKNSTNKTVTWKSSNTKVATVNSKGKVTAKSAGTAKITARTSNGKTAAVTVTVPYTKSLGTGTWKAGRDLQPGRYRITTKSGSGNLFITMKSYDRYVNEILSSDDDGFGVTRVTTDIKSGDKIEIMGLNSVQFTKVKHVKSNTLHSGYWTVGKDISPGRYKITTPKGSGNLIIHRGYDLLVNEILSSKREKYTVTSVTTTLKSGDKIHIAGLNKVNFSKR